MDEKRYVVQLIVIEELEVQALDELQAERVAFQALPPGEQEKAIALRVMRDGDDGGALKEDTLKAWAFARGHFHAIDMDWVS